MRVLLISTYELGRQPFGLASPAAWLAEAGVEVTCADLSRGGLSLDAVRESDLVAFYLPMHTATRLAIPVIQRVRELNPAAHLCAFGLYAPINESFLRASGVHTILGGEFEQDLVALASSRQSALVDPSSADACLVHSGPFNQQPSLRPSGVPRLHFRTPDRRGLPPLARYASLELGNGQRRVVGYTEASRGCKHRCRHCPVVPIYNGQFRVVPADVVMADIRSQIALGAQHITFGDPDFFNGIGHALGVIDALSHEFPSLTYDATIKVEHLLKHAVHLPRLRDTGCLFVTTAAESVDDRVLAVLEKGHTRADFVRLVGLAGAVGLTLSPTFVPFTPWTTLEGYCELLRTIAALELTAHVAPIQLAIRLLLPEGSRLLELGEVRRLVGAFEPQTLAYPWEHPDPRVDALQHEVADLVGVRLNASRREVFEQLFELAHERAELDLPAMAWPGGSEAVPGRATVPYLNEPWYC